MRHDQAALFLRHDRVPLVTLGVRKRKNGFPAQDFCKYKDIIASHNVIKVGNGWYNLGIILSPEDTTRGQKRKQTADKASLVSFGGIEVSRPTRCWLRVVVPG